MGCMGSKNKGPAKTITAAKIQDPTPKNQAKWWLEPVGSEDKGVTLALDGKNATGKQGS